MLFLWILLAITVLVLFKYFYLIVKRLILLKKIGKWVKKRKGSMQYCRNPLISVFRHDGKTDISLQFREKTIDISIITTPLRRVRYHFDIDDKLLYLIIERKAVYVGGTRVPKPTYISAVDRAFTIRKYRMEFRADNDHQKYVILNPAPKSISKVTGATSEVTGVPGKHKKMLLIVVAVLVLLCGCDPSSVRVVDTNRFGDYDIYVQTALDKQVNRLFPSYCPKEAGISNYDYYYQCGIFGDPSFWIVVSFVFNNQMDFDNEKERIQLNASHEIETDDSILLFNTIGNMEYYLDEKVLDGYYYILDMAIIKNRREISYFYVLWQDNAGQNKYIDMITVAHRWV